MDGMFLLYSQLTFSRVTLNTAVRSGKPQSGDAGLINSVIKGSFARYLKCVSLVFNYQTAQTNKELSDSV